MAKRLSSKVAVITGAAGGIGSRMASLFAEEGACVVLADIADEAGLRIAQGISKHGGQATYIHADVSKSRDVSRLMGETERRYGGVDVLVNNAIQIAGDTTMTDVSEEVFDRVIAVCLKGPFLCSQAAIPLMKKTQEFEHRYHFECERPVWLWRDGLHSG